MIDQTLISSALPLISGGGLGFAAGWALKKIAKLLLLGLGALVLLLGYLEYQKLISVNWTVVENQTSAGITTATNKAYQVTQTMGHQIPQGIGLGAIAFLPGLMIGFAKG